MRQSVVVFALGIASIWPLFGQRERRPDHPPFEVMCAFPPELSPGHYRQVEQRELQVLADQGWELVSVMPYIYRNEERGNDNTKPKPVVTQTYPAYFFKRPKIVTR